MFLTAGIYLANPWGLLGLVGVPATVIIFIIQTRAREYSASTLFLLEMVSPREERGTKLDRWRSSPSFWLTLAAVLLATWSISEPRYIRPQSAQRIALVLDSSYSMHPFLKESRRASERFMRAVAAAATRTEWEIVPTDPRAPPFYRGVSLEKAIESLEAWQSTRGAHDIAARIEAITAVRSHNSLTVLVSDRPQPLPERVEHLSVAHALDNVGFVGSRVLFDEGTTRYEALVMNHSPTEQIRKIQTGNTESSVTLAPGEMTRLSGSFAASSDEVEMRLQGDDFSLDDSLALRVPRARSLNVHINVADKMYGHFRRIVASLPGAKTVAAPGVADIVISERLPSGVKGIELAPPTSSNRLSAAIVVKAPSSLTDGLRFDGLVTDAHLTPAQGSGEPVLWRGSEVLVSRRPGPALQLHFDIRTGNARTHPGLLVLFSRFFEEVRQEKVALERKNFDMGERIRLPHQAGVVEWRAKYLDGSNSETASFSSTDSFSLRAPTRPASFEVLANGTPIVEGTSNFVEITEAKFTDAKAFQTVEQATVRQVVGNSEPDSAQGIWIILALLSVLAAWYADRVPRFGRVARDV